MATYHNDVVIILRPSYFTFYSYDIKKLELFTPFITAQGKTEPTAAEVLKTGIYIHCYFKSLNGLKMNL